MGAGGRRLLLALYTAGVGAFVSALLTVPQPAHASPISSLPVSNCKPAVLANSGTVELGFPRPLNRAPSLGTLSVHSVFVDFVDSVAPVTVHDYFSRTVLPALQDLERLSYGRLTVEAVPPSQWLRMPRASTSYAYGRGMSGANHLAFIQDAVDQADPGHDFSQADIVIVVTPPNVQDPRYDSSAALMGTPTFAVIADGNRIKNAVTVGTDWPSHRSRVVAHETLHSLGLVDLYVSSSASPELGHAYVGGFSLMGNVGGANSELFAWERWVLGWLEDSQATCLGSGTHEVALDSVARQDGKHRLAVLPLGGTRFLAVEARTRSGLDSNGLEGVLAYIVDPSIPTGSGPIRVPTTGPGSVMKPLVPGQTAIVEGIGVEVLGRTEDAFRVRLHTSVPALSLPSQVQSPTIARLLGWVTVTWQPPLHSGWTPITAYEYRMGSGRWTRTSEMRIAFRGGKRGQVLTVDVRAVNSVGVGPATRLTLRVR